MLVLSYVLVLNVLTLKVDGLLSDMYCSSEHLQSALEIGYNLLKSVDFKHIQHSSVVEKIKSYKSVFKNYTSYAKKWTDGIARHPIYVYNLVRDLYSIRELNRIANIGLCTDDLPTKEDFLGTVSAMIRLQDTYQLNVTEIANGVIKGEKSVALRAEDCVIMAVQAESEKSYIPAVLWSNEAVTRGKQGSVAVLSRALAVRTRAEFKMGLKELAAGSVKQWLQIDSTNAEAQKLSKEITEFKASSVKYQFDASTVTYKMLCSGLFPQSNLRCRYYDHNRDPRLLLQPVRQEELSVDPFIVAYRDVISESEIESLKVVAKPDLRVSLVGQDDINRKKSATKSKLRVSKGSFLRFEEPVVEKLQRRISAITGLRWDSFEQLQVANYGVGGYYSLHYDWNKDNEDPLNNERIATFMFYLNNVEEGGATVFPSNRVQMVPSKGDALFWYNQHRNGTGILATQHAACPVLLGTKWVANQWIRQYYQEFTRPCSLNPNE